MKFIPKNFKKNPLLRKFWAILAHIYFGFPGRKLIFIGVTGTSGKTTTTFLIKSILEAAGIKTGLIGTAGCYLDKEVIYSQALGPGTTPDPFILHRILRKMVNQNIKAVVLEVSSSGLMYWRTYGIHFQAAVLTNIDYNYHVTTIHSDMDDYVKAKLKLFQYLSKDSVAVLPGDNQYFDLFQKNTKATILKYGFDSSCDLWTEMKTNNNEDDEEVLIHFKDKTFSLRLRIPRASFNILNSLAAIGAVSKIVTSEKTLKAGLEGIDKIPGRLELILNKAPFTIIVDKANTYLTFQGLINFIKDNYNNNYNNNKIKRKIAVYGNFRELSLEERKMMAKVACDFFDLIVITQDDPKDESPQKGIEDFLNFAKKNNIPKDKYLTILDRREAIKTAIEKAQDNDLIVILGRGNEQFMLYKNKKIPFDDRAVTKEILKELGYLL